MLERRRDGDSHPRVHQAERRFTIQSEGWCVWEDKRNHSLVFETDKIARRVCDYVADWRELTDKELFALSWSR
jgi:predicted Rdx family selenoprotein